MYVDYSAYFSRNTLCHELRCPMTMNLHSSRDVHTNMCCLPAVVAVASL